MRGCTYSNTRGRTAAQAMTDTAARKLNGLRAALADAINERALAPLETTSRRRLEEAASQAREALADHLASTRD